MSTDTDGEYILQTGEGLACDRLAIQSLMIQDITEVYLGKAGLKAGMIVCDIGCGNGVMTEYLARQVGPEGRVYAIDKDQAQLQVTCKRMLEAGLTNVEYIQEDITSTDAIKALGWKADVVLMRLVLIHLTDPMKALENIKFILQDAGKVVSWESVVGDSLNDDKAAPVIKEYIAAILDFGDSNGMDFNFGDRLKEAYEASGYKVDECVAKKVAFDLKIVRKHHQMMLDEIKGPLMSNGLLSAMQVADVEKTYTEGHIDTIGILEPRGVMVLGGLDLSSADDAV